MQCFKSIASPTGISKSCIACSKIKPAESLKTACCVLSVRLVCFDDHTLAFSVRFVYCIADRYSQACHTALCKVDAILQTLQCFCAITIRTALAADMTQHFWHIHVLRQQVDSSDTLCSQQIRPTSLQHATIHTVFQGLLSLFRQQKHSSPAQACCTNFACHGTKHNKPLLLTPKLIDH